jgi:rfaE bifunctional protein kinase chain/domain
MNQKPPYPEIIDRFAAKKIAVIGDVMLDQYFWGPVRRISPEAPVPIVGIERETMQLGGAANVANNIRALGATPILLGVVGADIAAESLRKVLTEQQLSAEGIISDPSRCTTTKVRIIAETQHVVRADREQLHEITPDIEAKLMEVLKRNIATIDAVILEDYNKGVLTERFITQAIELARSHKVPVAVDPKFQNFFAFKNVTLFKPNRHEIERATGTMLNTSTEDAIAADLIKRLSCEYLLITLGERGMKLYEKNGAKHELPAMVRELRDVSGAGDTVVSTFTLALVSGATPAQAAYLSTCAAGVVCGKVGVQPIFADQLKDAVDWGS